MLSGIFQKRKKIQELRAPSLQDIKKFRDVYARYADKRHVETPPCFEKSIYKAISCQKELQCVDFRQEDVTDPQIIALAEALLEMPIISSLDLRDNRITDDGAKALLEVLRLQIIAAKTPPKTDPKTKKLIPPPLMPDYARYVTSINVKGNEISTSVLEELAHYTEILKREDKRLEIRAALNQVDQNSDGSVGDEDLKAVLKLLTGTEASKKEVRQLASQSHVSMTDSVQNIIALENVLLARCSSSPSKKAACPPWEAIVQVRHANLGEPRWSPYPSHSVPASVDASTAATRGDTKGPPGGSVRNHLGAPGASRSDNIQTSATNVVVSSPQKTQVMTTSPSSTPAPTSTAPATTPQPNLGSLSPSFSSSSNSVPSSPGSRTSSFSQNFKPPASPPPPLPLPQTTGPEPRSSNPNTPMTQQHGNDGDSPRGSIGWGVTESRGPSPVAKERMSLLPARGQEPQDASRPPAASQGPQPSSSVQDDYTLDFSTWKDTDDVFTDDEGDTSHNGSGAPDDGSLADDEESKRSAELQSLALSKGSSSASGRNQGNSNQNRVLDPASVPRTFVNASEGEVESEGTNSRRRERGHPHSHDLSSLVYEEREDVSIEGNNTGGSLLSPASPDTTSNQKALDEQLDANEVERIECCVLDVVKDQKPRNIAKLIHTEFKRGLLLQDFPDAVPFRNLIALVLSENGLRDLTLFKECRFPVATVLDLSKNRLTKLRDEDLAIFPKLQVIDLSENRFKSISGLGKLLDIRALNLSRNQIKTVINIEHLVNLRMLNLRDNCIAAMQALRLLSLNRTLTHLELEGNPIVETEERQRRKITVHILNIIPTLWTLGAVPIAGHNSKDKRKLTNLEAPMGPSLMDHETQSELRLLWVSGACDVLKICQDREVTPPPTNDYDDPYNEGSGDILAPTGSPTRAASVKLTREEQRQKDELRSNPVAYRSRGKAPPSPPRTKTSPYAFGPPIPPPPKKASPRKSNPALAKKQQRRSSELSAPKHPPVDPTLFQQEQRRKSRPAFDVNMSVAERLELARVRSDRRLSTSVTSNATNRVSITAHTRRVTGQVVNTNGRPPTPRENPSVPAIEFRIEPLPPSPPRVAQTPVIERRAPGDVSTPASSQTMELQKTSGLESNFLQSLAVTDFLTHAEEETSTAATALNVLLSMSEREPSDPNKLREYRSSLDALDILNERESQELYQKARLHVDPAKVQECTSAFEKLGRIKKSIKALLAKLEAHAPGSATIRAYCQEIRSAGLCEMESAECDDVDTEGRNGSASSTSTPVSRVLKETTPQPAPSLGLVHSESSPAPSLHARLFSSAREHDSSAGHHQYLAAQKEPSVALASSAEDEFDFLSTETSVFDEDDETSVPVASQRPPQMDRTDAEPSSLPSTTPDEFDFTSESPAKPLDTEDEPQENEDPPENQPLTEDTSTEEEHHPLTSTDITQDIQGDDDDDAFDFDSDLPLDMDSGTPDAGLDVDQDDRQPLDNVTSFDDDEAAESTPAPPTQPHRDIDEFVIDESQEVTDGQPQRDMVREDQGLDFEELDAADEGEDHELEADAALVRQSLETEDSAEDPKDESSPGETDDGSAAVEPTDELLEAEDEDDEEAETFGDWEKGFDPNTNHYFWFNHATGESQWTPPEGWPFEVDTPFEEDGAVVGDGEEGEKAVRTAEDEDDGGGDDGGDDATVADGEDPTQRSMSFADDELFSDQDLPDF